MVKQCDQGVRHLVLHLCFAFMFWGGGGGIFAFENYPQMTTVFLVLAVEVCVSLPYGCELAVLGLAEVPGRR